MLHRKIETIGGRLRQRMKNTSAGDFYFILGFITVILGCFLKLVQVWFSSATVDADSAVVGLMGLHILHLTDWPIFFYGQAYMGSFQAIVAAVYFRFLGVSPSSLYSVSTTFWILFVLANFFLIKRVFGRWPAVLASLFLAFPPAYLADRLFRTWGGYMEMLFFGTCILLITLKIIDKLGKGENNHRWFGLLGFVIGVSLWIHFSVMFYIVTALLIFAATAKKTAIRRRDLGFFFIFAFIPLIPMILYNVFPVELAGVLHFPLSSSEPGQTLKYLFTEGQPFKVRLAFGLDNLQIVAKVSLPLILGIQSSPGFYLLPIFSKLLFIFYGLVLVWTVIKWDSLFRRIIFWQPVSKEVIARLYPFILLVLAIVGYCFGNFAFSFGDPRYILSLYSVFPLLAAEFILWLGRRNITLLILLTAFVLINHLYPAYGTHLDIPIFSKPQSRETQLIERLNELNLKRIYAGYLTGYPVTFLSGEKIIASPKYGPHNINRYPRYTEIVDDYPNPAYVFPVNGPNDCCEADLTAILSLTKTGHKLSSTKDFNIYYDLDRDIRPYLKTAK